MAYRRADQDAHFRGDGAHPVQALLHFRPRRYSQLLMCDTPVPGLGTGVLRVKDQIRAIFHVAEYYYPETLWKMFLINAPWVFRSIWMVIQPLIHEKTRVKIKLMGGNYIEEMKEHGVDPDQLPVSIGGTYEINHLAPQ
mmetsp:Transcript_37252/g.80700  ORF Transcript_37252/g.80700 Transcript_37252/m.80700 type:complete len:139 (-) Transcript_37252:43-459(-)